MVELPARGFTLELPGWVAQELASVPPALPTTDARMRLVNRLAARNFREGNGGPFAALVVEAATGRLVSAGVNVVLGSGLSLGHAEVMALGIAEEVVGQWDLGAAGLPDHQLVVNWRPCVQCYGAAMWSGVRSLVVAGDGPELESITGFDEGPMRDDWAAQFEARGIAVETGVLRNEAIAVFEDYRAFVASTGATVYNARAARGIRTSGSGPPHPHRHVAFAGPRAGFRVLSAGGGVRVIPHPS